MIMKVCIDIVYAIIILIPEKVFESQKIILKIIKIAK